MSNQIYLQRSCSEWHPRVAPQVQEWRVRYPFDKPSRTMCLKQNRIIRMSVYAYRPDKGNSYHVSSRPGNSAKVSWNDDYIVRVSSRSHWLCHWTSNTICSFDWLIKNGSYCIKLVTLKVNLLVNLLVNLIYRRN